MDNSDFFLGEIRAFPYNFVPAGFSACNGQKIMLNSNDAYVLYSILSTNFGGDGSTYFNLPNIQGMVPVGTGTGPQKGNYRIGSTGGVETVTVTTDNTPQHTHQVNAAFTAQAFQVLSKEVHSPNTPCYIANLAEQYGTGVKSGRAYIKTMNNPMSLYGNTLTNFTGGNMAHNNVMPYLAMIYCICVSGGTYPVRS